MIDPWVWCAAAALGAAAFAVSPCAAAIAALGVALLVWRRAAHPPVVIACALLFAGQAARATSALARARELHAASVAALTPPAVCAGRAEIVGSPVASVRGPEDERGAGVATRASVRILDASCEGRAVPAGLVARLYDLPDDLRRGDEIEFTAKLLPVHLFEHAELASPWPAIARSEIVASGAAADAFLLRRPLSLTGAIDAARASVRRRILATYAPDAAALGRALVLGETDLTDDDTAAFRDSGLLHLLAVSGTHLVLVVSALSGALRRLLLHIEPLAARTDVSRPAAALGLLVAWLYADFAGGGGSAVRAAAMLTVALLARALGERPAAGGALAIGLLGAAIADPLVALDMSFGLSAGATAGLVVLGGRFSDAFTALVPESKDGDRPGAFQALRRASRAGSRHILASIATTLAATVGSTPAMMRLSPRLPLLGVLANILAAPLGELIALPVCLGHAAAFAITPLERALALSGSGALLAVRAIARAAASAGSGLHVPPPTPVQLAVLAMTAAAFAAARGRARLSVAAAAAASLLLLEITQVHAGRPSGLLRITALDVGQGDSVLIDFPDGRAMLIDGGGMVGNPVDPGARVALPVLAARRRTRLDVLALTHPHPDHFTGLATVAAELPFAELWESGQGEALGVRGPYAALLGAARSRGAQVRRPPDLCGRPRSFGDARVEVVWPCPRLDPSSEANNASLVMRIDYGRRSALLVGDAEREAEHGILASGTRVRADLLKVGHHGSRTSSSEAFLRAVAPSVAMVSCGVRNRFGHPHAEAMARLAGVGAAVLRTDQGGAIVWETDGDTVRIRRP